MVQALTIFFSLWNILFWSLNIDRWIEQRYLSRWLNLFALPIGISGIYLGLHIQFTNQTTTVALITGSSITIAFWFGERMRRYNEYRIIRSHLATILHELEFNNHLLEQLKKNYLFSGLNDQSLWVQIAHKHHGLESIIGQLRTESYAQLTQGGLFGRLPTDYLANILDTAYDDLYYIRVLNINTSLSLFAKLPFLPTKDKLLFESFRENISTNITNTATEITYAVLHTKDAITSIKTFLSETLPKKEKMVYTLVDRRNETLGKSDQDFINNCIK